jgi:peptidoglycan/LPS O-acetylase OafA/YrhL
MNKDAVQAGGGYIKSLDGVRAIAILLVMTFHANMNYFGWMGVQLFFVLSGFLITGILWREKEREGTMGFKLKKFWVRRSLRIFPLYFGWLIFLGITYLAFHFPSYFETYFPYLATYTVNYSRTLPEWQGNPLFTHLWSLAIEEQFYLFFPFVMFLLPRRWVKYFMIFFVLFSPVTRFLIGEYYEGRGFAEPVVADAVYWNTLSHLDAFFMGGLIPVFSLDRRITNPRWLLLFSFIIAVALGFLNYLEATPAGVAYVSELGYNHGQTARYEHVWHYSALNLLFASLILALASAGEKDSFLSRIFRTEWLVAVGRVSYGMYVFHWAVLVYVFHRIIPVQSWWMKMVMFVPYAVTVYVLAKLSYRFFESYFLKLKERWFPEKKTV